jgi:hypothetical protein
MPPSKESKKILNGDGGSPKRNKAGTVKITPAARPSPTEAIVCTILFSKIDALLKKIFSIAIEITAAGMDADTVVPTFKPRYALPTPNTNPQD